MKYGKRIVALALVLTLVFACVASAQAESCREQLIGAAVTRMVTNANRQIAILVRIAQATPFDDTDELVITTNAIASRTIRNASQLGYVVACDYKTYWVDGQSVVIDPLRVIGPKESMG